MEKEPITPSILRKIYYYLVKIRKFEEKIVEVYPKQQIRCPVHLYIGQEAIAVGVGIHLNKRDYVFSNHRNHGHLIAKGADLKSMLAEIYGKKNGCSKGKGGSMHMIFPSHSILGTSAIVGGGIPIGLGTALASKMKKDRRISVIFFGDGAAETGIFFESLNFACLKKLPVLFVCENNFYATNSPHKNRQANLDIFKIANFFSIPGCLVDGNDVFKVFSVAKQMIKRIRQGKGPVLIEARTYRWKTHVGPETDIEKGFRQRREVEKWFKKCPIKRFRDAIDRDNLLSKSELTGIENRVKKELDEALDFALNSPYPDKEDLTRDVY
jgi:pyruvate dehydrogenase E1 component alpha subunit